MKISNALTTILIVIFVGCSAWLAYSMLRMQQQGEAGLIQTGSGETSLYSEVESFTARPSAAEAMRLLPLVREIYEKNHSFRARLMLSIVLYYNANLAPEQFHGNLREALPLLMENYREGNATRSITGEMLINYLALAMLDGPFGERKQDLLTMEPYMREDVELQQISMLLEMDDEAGARELCQPYITGPKLSSNEKLLAFEVHCLLDEFDQASQYEADVLRLLLKNNSSETKDNDPEKRPLIDGITYSCLLNYLLDNAKYELAREFIETSRNNLLDPAVNAGGLAIASAGLGDNESEQFRAYIREISDSPFLDISMAGAESSVYRSLAESGSAANWLSTAATLYSGNETDPELLMNLAWIVMLSDREKIELTDTRGKKQTYNAIQLAQSALVNSETYLARQHSLLTLCTCYAALPDADINRARQSESLEYLRKALNTMHVDDDQLPMAARVDLSLITQNRLMSRLREASPDYDAAVHDQISDYLSRLHEFYGADPLGLKTESK